MPLDRSPCLIRGDRALSMRVAIALTGLHRVNRGAEVAFEALARALAADSRDRVTLIGSGRPTPEDPYSFVRAASIDRGHFERWPKFPPLRSEMTYEELSWVPGVLRHYRPSDFDISLTCSYPFTNWLLRARRSKGRPAHVFVTENGDWAPKTNSSEFRLFGCDGLVCTNPEYMERNKDHWMSALIPNGVDGTRFFPAARDRAYFGLPESAPIVLMVSALNPNKRVLDGIRVVAGLPEAWLVVAGDGSQRKEVDELAAELLPNRFRRLNLESGEMPGLYRCADAFLHMTYFESFGNVYIEAMACGIPVVAHRSSVTDWIIGANGILVDTDDLPATRTSLEDVLAGRFTVGARETATMTERFDWQTIAREYRAFFTDVLEKRLGA